MGVCITQCLIGQISSTTLGSQVKYDELDVFHTVVQKSMGDQIDPFKPYTHSGIVPIWHGDVSAMGPPRGLDTLVGKASMELNPPATVASESLQNGAILETGVTKLCRGHHDVFHHCPASGTVRACSGSGNTGST